MRDTQDGTLEGIILDVIKRHTQYDKTYSGQVVNVIDPLLKGRILCLIPDLGWITPDVGVWCFPRQVNAITTPMMGSYVEIAFLGGDVNWPVYRGVAGEVGLLSGLPTTWRKLPTHHVLFESPVTKAYMSYDDLLTLFEIFPIGFLKIGLGIEPMIKGASMLIEHTKLSFLLVAMVAGIDALLTAGVSAGGVGAPNFVAAQTAWNTIKATFVYPSYSIAQLSTTILGQ